MTTAQTFTGDLLISINTDGDWDLNFELGQPIMTDGFETAVIFAVFGEPDFWQNDLTDDPNEKYISEFPSIIQNGKVDDPTLKAGTAALKKALQFMIDINAAESIEVSGSVLSVFGLSWEIDIVKGGITSKYTINWDKGVIEIAGIPIFDGTIEPKRFHSPMLNPDNDVMINPNGDIQLYEYAE